MPPRADEKDLPQQSPLRDRLMDKRVSYGRFLRPFLIRRSTQFFLDGLAAFAAVCISYGIRFDFHPPVWSVRQMWGWGILLAIVEPLVISSFGGYRSTWQFFGMRDMLQLAKRVVCINIVLLIVPLLTVKHHWIPYSIIILDLLFTLLFCGSIRMLRRLDHEALHRLSPKERIFIAGSEQTVAGAIRQLMPVYGQSICGIVVDESSLHERDIHGVPVLGTMKDLNALLVRHSVSLLFLSSAGVKQLREIMQVAADLDVTVKLLPSVHDLVGNTVRVSRNVTVAAYRDEEDGERAVLHPAVIHCLEGRTVLVTGAGGSIGSELVRQIARVNVAKLILLDQDENAVFELLGELGPLPFVQPVIADIRDREALRHLFAREHPQVVLHAAAYKHVPMMEANPCEAVLNNVIGTRTLAEAAADFNAERMVMISSDKAVRPSSVMGATKRLAELVIQRLSTAGMHTGCQTQFACVRFGNVLGSRGSVIPIFLKQIEAGGPVTVTHEEMTRYFMTIPQAVQLVLQAATLASCGDVYMLDMGDPVRIVNLARDVIYRAGLTPGKDIEIKVVGSRPGEKLHEQLWLEDANVSQTEFDQIHRVHAEPTSLDFPEKLLKLEDAAHSYRPEEIRALLHELPIDYLSQRQAEMASTPR